MNELRSIEETPPATPVAGPLGMPFGMDQQSATNSSDSRKLSGRKKVRRDRSAAYREIQRLKVAGGHKNIYKKKNRHRELRLV
jgi:hypothetical protein